MSGLQLIIAQSRRRGYHACYPIQWYHVLAFENARLPSTDPYNIKAPGNERRHNYMIDDESDAIEVGVGDIKDEMSEKGLSIYGPDT